MKRGEMTRLLKQELAHIPKRGDVVGEPYEQSEFRMFYTVQRQHDLSLDPTTPASRSLAQALADSARFCPGFGPTYDRNFFQA